jgi:SNF2 family DNA or RNA helicase
MLANYIKIQKFHEIFQLIKWEYFVADEVHSMKNSNLMLYQVMPGLSFPT